MEATSQTTSRLFSTIQQVNKKHLPELNFDSLPIKQNGRRSVVHARCRADRGEIGLRRRSVVALEAVEYLLLAHIAVADNDEFQFEVVALAVHRRRWRTVQKRVIEMSEMVVLIADAVLVVVSRLDRLRAARVQAARGEADRVQGTVFVVHRIASGAALSNDSNDSRLLATFRENENSERLASQNKRRTADE